MSAIGSISQPAATNIKIGPDYNWSSSAIGAANSVYVAAFDVKRSVIVTTVSFFITIQSGNLEFGIYDDTGLRLGSTGIFACPAAGNRSQALLAPIALVPGKRYFAANAFSDGVASIGRVARIATTGPAPYLIAGQIGATAMPMPLNIALVDNGVASIYYSAYS